MEYILNNGKITLTVKSKGAEIKSLVDNETNREYIWEADPKHWGRSSPILFPIVGGLVNQEYRYDGKTYHMAKHGFAKEMEFTVKEQTDTSIWFVLKSNEETMGQYPFIFTLELGYELKEKSVKAVWRVINEDDKMLYFSVGGHPAFVCPLEKNGNNRVGCFIGFEDKESISSTVVTKTGYIGVKQKEYKLEKGLLKIETGLFDEDALILENHQVQSVTLYDEKKNPYITADFDAPLFGIWSVPSDEAGYVCIEPWYGLGDREGFQGELQERDYGQCLESGSIFEKFYTITIH